MNRLYIFLVHVSFTQEFRLHDFAFPTEEKNRKTEKNENQREQKKCVCVCINLLINGTRNKFASIKLWKCSHFSVSTNAVVIMLLPIKFDGTHFSHTTIVGAAAADAVTAAIAITTIA